MNKIKAGSPNHADTRVANTPTTSNRPNNKTRKSVLNTGTGKHITSFVENHELKIS